LKTAVVIGAGFVGASCAWQMQRAGFQVTLVDPGDDEAAASWGNAGHLAVEQIDPLASIANLCGLPRRLFTFGGPVGLPVRDVATWLPFGLKLIAASSPARFALGRTALSALLAQAMPAWHRLAAQTGTAQHLREDGHFVAWESRQTAERGKRHWLQANVGTARVQAASNADLGQLRDTFNQRPVDAVRFHGSGQILDLAKARSGMVDALRAAGGVTQTARASAITINHSQATAQLADGTTLTPDVLVVAAGAASADLLRASEGAVPLIAERGYHVQVQTPPATHALPPVAFEDRSVIVTRFFDTLRIAGFTEFSRVTSPPDARKWQALSRHASELGLPFSQHTTRWIGARPTLPDYLPAVGRSRAAANLIYAFGHQHLGVTLAAITGELVAAVAVDASPSVDLKPFDLGRFQ
jgi:D-hydroxyproline dehydrogenase